jgi:hypothetical protein
MKTISHPLSLQNLAKISAGKCEPTKLPICGRLFTSAVRFLTSHEYGNAHNTKILLRLKSLTPVNFHQNFILENIVYRLIYKYKLFTNFHISQTILKNYSLKIRKLEEWKKYLKSFFFSFSTSKMRWFIRFDMSH